MLLPKFEYHRPGELAQALELMAELGPEARPLAGGTDLLVNLKYQREQPAHLVSLQDLAELGELSRQDGGIRLGAGLRVAHLAGGPEACRDLGALVEGAASLGSPQIRNRATLGGNLCSARPAADLVPPLLVLGARLVLQSRGQERQVELDEFLQGPGQTLIQPQELLTAVVVDAPPPGSGSAFQKLGIRRAMEIARVNAAASLVLAEDGRTIARARVALGAVGPRARLSARAQEVLEGQTASEELFAQAGQAAVEDASPRTCHEFKCEVVSVLTRRCLLAAWQQARGGTA